MKEDEDEDCGTKEMRTKDLTDILSSINMAAEKLCDIDPDWESNYTAKRGVRVSLHTYEILQEKKKKSQQLMLRSCLMSSVPWPGPSTAK
jgi:hypothetical protein